MEGGRSCDSRKEFHLEGVVWFTAVVNTTTAIDSEMNLRREREREGEGGREGREGGRERE